VRFSPGLWKRQEISSPEIMSHFFEVIDFEKERKT
jgi:hypothetical protein